MAEEVRRRYSARQLDVHAALKVGLLLLMIVVALAFVATVILPSRLLVDRTALLILQALSLAIFPLATKLLWERFSWTLLYLVVVIVVALIALTLYFAGPGAPFGVMNYVLIAIYASYYFSLRRTISIVVLIAFAYAVQLAVQSGHTVPVARWLWVVGVIGISVTFVDSLIRRAERSAEREMKAREAEQTARQAEEIARLELARANEALEARVSDQVREMERLGRLRRFLSPNLADVVVGSENESFLEPHRREIAVFFIDLRGFTRFASAAEPEDVLEVLRAYYDKLGLAFSRFEATVGPLQGDGVMAYFNDPFPCADPAGKAVEMAGSIADSLDALGAAWDEKGYDLGYGMGIAFGHATLGMIGFEGRQDYGPLGTVVNLASRLCDIATPGQVLVDRRTASAVSQRFECNIVQTVEIKGFRDPVDVFQAIRSGHGPPR
jgi:class 3 adenylate cyclase